MCGFMLSFSYIVKKFKINRKRIVINNRVYNIKKLLMSH